MTKRYMTEVHYEANREPWKKRQYERFDHKCVYCGSTEYVEIHHIVPKNQGGDNRDSNIVCLCRRCHAKAHNKAQYHYTYTPGRKRVQPKADVDTIMRRYIDGDFRMLDAMEILGFKRNKFNRELQDYRKRTGDTRPHLQIH